MANELTLKGSMYGIKKPKAYNNPDIIQSIVDKHACEINRLRISYIKDTKKFYMYHSYDGLASKYSGRWHLSDYFLDTKI